ncbi:MAG: carboxypeptidase regulatory-like domain-containing protein [Acidimicrobiia bacterium]|nr:carboxypeptidase regulatory-like domain-containing protein [Acidimicrobiia bacterium]
MLPGVALAALLAATLPGVNARQAGVSIDKDDIGGVVTSAKGPEAGVWVIAETRDLPTNFIKIAVTDDQGRYVVPDLPAASYSIWVRGYGLVDSPKVTGVPGKALNLTAVVAPDAKAAAEYYPANYWLALLEPPPASDFPGTGRDGNGLPEALRTQGAWIGHMKQTGSCVQCHQLGTKATREFHPAQPKFATHLEAWDYRVQTGQSGAFMNNTFGPIGRDRSLAVFADWTQRIANGELPEAPPRPQGVERNVVVSQWEVGDPKVFVHDEITTDRRNPTLNGYGPVYAVQELSGDYLIVLDPVKYTTRKVHLAPADPTSRPAWAQDMPQPSNFWGNEVIWEPRVVPHNPWIDAKGRVWITARGGCRMYDPKDDSVTRVEGCPGTHHVQIDDNEVLWFDQAGAAYFDIKKWEQTGDGKAAGGTIPFVLDTNANGKLDEPPVAANEPIDPARDKAIRSGGYDVIPNPVDGSVWISVTSVPGSLVRVDPKTRLAEVYEPPYMNPAAKIEGYLPHGIDVDRKTGLIWTGLNSGHLASFDRRKCKVTNGPTATGQHCPEGWTLYRTPGPQFKGVKESGNADGHYLNWNDWYNISGFGDDTPFVMGTNSDSIIALDRAQNRFVVMRVPYPMGFFPRGMDGRIDDPNAGWKGRGLWSTQAAQATWHQEGGTAQRPKIVQFQIRPNPLAK